MFQNEELKTHLESSFTIESKSALIAEWNMNIPGNIFKLGNYRYRNYSGNPYKSLPNNFDRNDIGNYYTGATDSDIVIENGLQTDSVTPLLFLYSKDKEKLYYSLEDCIKPFRPRSGINKASYFNTKYFPSINKDMYLRPRYYMSHRDDEFKYWRSYRTESNHFIPVATKISNYAMVSSISGTGPWTGTITGIDSTSLLSVNKLFSVSPNNAVNAGISATVGTITGTGPWTATVTGLTSTAELFVGDIITATDGTGKLFGGTPTKVIIKTKPSLTSITYEVTGGTAPVAGTVSNVTTVPGSIGDEEIRVVTIPSASSITFIKESGTTAPTLGSLLSLYTTVYPKKDESNIEYGISNNSATGYYKIDDTVPFVVYKEDIPANRIIVKVQTNVGDLDYGTFKDFSSVAFSDPFYGDSKKTVPKKFKVQYLDSNSMWNDAYSFDQTAKRDDGTDIFGTDGYLSLQYGMLVPQEYADNFLYVGKISSEAVLPTSNIKGYSYLLQTEENTKGTLYIYDGFEYNISEPVYSWKIGTDPIYENTQFVTELSNPEYFYEPSNENKIFREFVFIKGIRLVVDSMNLPDIPFELIEFSPRLAVDLTLKLETFTIDKVLSNLTQSAVPVGELLVSTGSLVLFDNDQSFNANNAWNGETGSIISNHMQKNIQFKFYEAINNVNGSNYYVPIKVMYSEGIPQASSGDGTISFSVRDFYFYLESVKAPEILLTEVSLSQAVCLLLDSIGFSNYVFKRLSTEKDPIIPFFFIKPEQNVAEVLNELAKATQSAMFFDEYNNFIVMTKAYLLDDTGERTLDMTLYGSNNSIDSGVIENDYNLPLSNIIEIASQDQKVYNFGTINYTARYIQRSYGTLKQALMMDEDKTWIYKPVLLWEVSGTENTKSLNEEKQSKYSLAAMPINSDLTIDVPQVINRQLVNNIVDFGENIYYITRYNGYFYSAGEIIKYDAIEYAVSGVGKVWISSNLEYQEYFANLPFNGKMYSTGIVRIFSEPYYETINGTTYLKNGSVASHGRGQFNTEVTSHSAGLSDYWSSNNNVRGCDMDTQYLYTTSVDIVIPPAKIPVASSYSSVAGFNQDKANKSQRNGIIKNFFSSSFGTEKDIPKLKSTQSGTIQSSALVFNGPDFSLTETAKDFVSYVYKQLDSGYKHFGTRIRVIGKIESAGDLSQSAVGGMTYYNVPGVDPTQPVSIGGGSGGICLVNPTTNNGYYFEIAALSSSTLSQYITKDPITGLPTTAIDNILFYKVQKSGDATSDLSKAMPIKLWGGNSNIIIDDGNFTGQARFVGEANPTVYDLSIEYVDINSTTRMFYLYINQKLVNTVIDTNPIPIIGNSIGLFVRGTSKVMFENIYALEKNYSDNSVFSTNVPISSIFGDDNLDINANEALSKYALSSVIQKTFLSGVSPTTDKKYNLYFEEFGSIMRECSYFNIKYDKAYPALYAKIAPTFNRLKGYVVSGFVASSYGAEFLVFNATDFLLNLDETTGNYLRIQGIAFTQDTTHKLTTDDYYKKRGNFSDPELKGDSVITSPYSVTEEYDQIRTSRILYGKNEFTLDSDYIQSQDAAEDILGWISKKTLKPRKAVGLNIFSMPILQLGDIVSINYKDDSGVDLVVPDSTRLVVYNIKYSKSNAGPTMSVYLSEV